VTSVFKISKYSRILRTL